MPAQHDLAVLQKRLTNYTSTAHPTTAILSNTVQEQLFERLAYIKLTPENIIDLHLSTRPLATLLQQQFPPATLHAIDILQADAGMAVLQNDIDLIISNLCFYWIEDTKPLLHLIYKTLKPGGLLLFSTLGPDTLQELRYCWAQVDSQPHVNHFADLHDIGDQLLSVGFQDPVMDRENIEIHYRNAIDLMRDIHLSGESNCHLQRQRSLISTKQFQAVLKHYEQFRGADAKLSATFEVTYGLAWRPTGSIKTSMNQQGEVHISPDDIVMPGRGGAATPPK